MKELIGVVLLGILCVFLENVDNGLGVGFLAGITLYKKR